MQGADYVGMALHGNRLHAMKPRLRHVLPPSTAFAKDCHATNSCSCSAQQAVYR